MPILVDHLLTTEASATTSRWFPLDISIAPFDAIIGVTMTSGATPDYRIEYTLDASAIQSGLTPVITGLLRTDVASATAFPLSFPVVAARVVVSALASGVGSPPKLRVWIVQAGK